MPYHYVKENDTDSMSEMTRKHFSEMKAYSSKIQGKICHAQSMGMGYTICFRRDSIDQPLLALVYDYSSYDYNDYLKIQEKFFQGYTNIDPTQNKRTRPSYT
jgi:hypothetical protein